MTGDRLHGTVKQHLVLDPDRLEFRQETLRFAEGVAEQQRGAAAIALPPVANLPSHLGSAVPSVDRHAEGGFRDQHITGHGFKRCTAGVVVSLVVATHNPDRSLRFQPDLSGTEHVAGTVERHPALIQPDRLAIGDRVQRDLLAESLSQNAFAVSNGPIFTAARSGMVGVGMGDQGPRHRTPGIDPGISCPAVQPLSGAFDQMETNE